VIIYKLPYNWYDRELLLPFYFLPCEDEEEDPDKTMNLLVP
jgi:hypothetical protein